DYMSFKGSTIEHEEILRCQLREAVKMLDPKAEVYFSQCLSQENLTSVACLQVEHRGKLKKPKVSVLKDFVLARLSPNQPTVQPPTQVRTIIRNKRFRLNEFRDNQWASLIRTRRLVMEMVFCTGLALYALVEFAIISNNVDGNILKAATAFYLIGGLIALFSLLFN